MPDGLDVIREAVRMEGVAEHPPGCNCGRHIDDWIAEASRAYGVHYSGAAWCAIFVRAMYLRAGLAIDDRLVHPFTGYICDRADELGGLAPKGLAPPASLVIKDGIHVGLCLMDHGDGFLTSIDGNSNHQVKRNYRDKRDWRIIVPPGVEHTKPKIIFRESYGFDDLNMKPLLYGPWGNKASRTKARKKYEAWAKEARPGWWTADVSLRRNGRTVFAFRSGPPGSYDYPWERGGWPTKEQRQEVMTNYMKQVGHGNMRPWKKRVQVPMGAVEITREETVT